MFVDHASTKGLGCEEIMVGAFVILLRFIGRWDGVLRCEGWECWIRLGVSRDVW